LLRLADELHEIVIGSGFRGKMEAKEDEKKYYSAECREA
jgi:hypothetical protein